MLACAAAGAWLCAPARAASVRLFQNAVVMEDQVRLRDVTEWSGSSGEEAAALTEALIGEAPPPGGSRIIHRDLIRAALVSKGINLSTVTIRGASQCVVTRPAAGKGPASSGPAMNEDIRHVAAASAMGGAPATTRTLRDAVTAHFQKEAARYQAAADVIFDKAADSVLELAEPAYQFRVRSRGSGSWGLNQVDVEVIADGRTVQTIPLVVQVSMTRRVAVARRPINQGATVQPADAGLIPLSFTRVDKLGVADLTPIIGQRAKRYVAAGTMIEPAMLESVPLVTRGQIVTLCSTAGGVRITTTGKAMGEGLLGETVAIRAADHQKLDLHAVVIGPGTVQIGEGEPAREGGVQRVARGDGS
jgi:flagella basal body P-ring formation protein FlgA